MNIRCEPQICEHHTETKPLPNASYRCHKIVAESLQDNRLNESNLTRLGGGLSNLSVMGVTKDRGFKCAASGPEEQQANEQTSVQNTHK